VAAASRVFITEYRDVLKPTEDLAFALDDRLPRDLDW
jgi:hypothetical protein